MTEKNTSSPLSHRFASLYGWIALSVMAITGAELGAICAGQTNSEAALHIRLWQGAYVLGFTGYLALLWSFHRRTPKAAFWLIGAMALRIPLLFAPPNSDCNRYIWEGRVQQMGFSPYVVAPDNELLVNSRDDIYNCINHKEYTTIYPPVSLLFFKLLAMIAYSVKTPQIAHAMLDIAVTLAIAGLLRSLGRPVWHAAIYGLCPLVLAAFAHAGHNDALMILPLVGFLAAAAKRRWALAGFLLGLAVLAKTTPIILFALLPRRSWIAIAVGLLTIAVGYALYWDSGQGVVHTLLRFPSESPFNNPIDALRVWVRQEGGPAIFLRQRNVVAALLLLAFAGYHAVKPGDLLVDARRLMAVALLCLPIIHFWYLTWPLALIALTPRGYWSWQVLCGTMALYWQADWAATVGASWKLPLWAVLAIWIPFWLAWGVERRIRPGSPSPSAP